MTEECELLRDYAENGADAAFEALVRRRIDFVYAAALRQVYGDVHLARDVTQCVFVDLARKAGALSRRTSIAGWLYTSARFAAAKTIRGRVRRLDREREAAVMDEIISAGGARDPHWEELRPVLDETMHELSEKDREALLLRFFEGRSLAEVGAALELGENSARMRVERALEKLRARLSARGITSTTAALGAVLAAQPTVAAPAGLAMNVAGISLAHAAVGGAGITGLAVALTLMNTTKLTMGMAGILAGFGIGAYVASHYASERSPTPAVRATGLEAPAMAVALRQENELLRSDVARLRDEISRTADRTAAGIAEPPAQPKDALAPLNLIMALQRRDVVDPQITFVTTEGKLDEAFTELFALTDSESERLQKAVDRARERLGNLERENAVVTRDGNGDYTVAVKAFPQAGGLAYDELMKSFADTLGPERNEAFKSLGAVQVERVLGDFGAPERTYVFKHGTATAGGKPYSVYETRKLPKESSSKSTPHSDRTDLVKHFGSIVDLLPPDF